MGPQLGYHLDAAVGDDDGEQKEVIIVTARLPFIVGDLIGKE